MLSISLRRSKTATDVPAYHSIECIKLEKSDIAGSMRKLEQRESEYNNWTTYLEALSRY